MMNKKRLTPYCAFLLMIVSIVACSVMEESCPSSDKNVKYSVVDRSAITKGGAAQEDSLQMVIEYQKNKTALLLNHIQEINDRYVLDLSQSDAIILGIPDSLYNWARYCVSCLNGEQVK